jgi:hypothetical protein
MALQIRRGTEAGRQAMNPPLVEGELAYVTNYADAEVSPLWVGDGETPGGIPVAPVLSVNTKTGTVQLYTDDVTEDDVPTNKWFTEDRAQDAAASLFTTTTTSSTAHTGISFAYNDADGKIVATVSPYYGTVSTGISGGIARYVNNDNVVSSTQALTWSETNKALTITTGEFVVTGNNSGRDIITVLTSANTAASNSFTFYRSRGTNTSPLISGSLDNLGVIQWSAYTDTSTYAAAAQIFANIANVAPSAGIARGVLSFATTGADGTSRARVRIDDQGRLFIGPYYSTDASISGSIILRQIESSSSVPTVAFRNYFSDDNGTILRLDKFRGTFTSYTAVQTNDTLASIQSRGASQSGVGGSLAGVVQSSSITMTVDGAVSTSIVPGAINFNVANSSGTIGRVVKINNNTTGSNGTVAVTGTLSSSVALATGVYADSTARDSAIPTPTIGMIVFVSGTGKFQGNTDGTTSGWIDLN